MKKKNILIISFDFCLEAGGIQNTSFLLAKEFSKFVNVFTFCPADGHSPENLSVRSFKGEYGNTISEQDKARTQSAGMIERLHLEYKFDYVLVLHYLLAFPALHLKNKYNVPYGVMTYGNDVMKLTLKRKLQHPRSAIKIICERKKILNNASQVYSCTNFTKSLVEELSSNKNIHVIHPPIGIENVAYSEKYFKAPILLSVGRLVERKGYQNVIKALPDVLKSMPSLKYIIAGTGEYESQLKHLVRQMNLSSFVEFKGRITEEEKCKLMSECGLFIMPSFIIKEKYSVEGFGLSMLEANMFGKFVISSLSGGIPEAVKEDVTGFLVGENDITGIARAILKFYDDTFTYDPSLCVEWAMEHDISNITKQYMSVICKQIELQDVH